MTSRLNRMLPQKILIVENKLDIQQLKCFLIDKGYEEAVIYESSLELYGDSFPILEIKEGNYVIQTFMLMSDDTRNSRTRYPIYKTYLQETPKGHCIYPACCIACLNDGGWKFYNASETCQPMKDSFVNYLKAKERFAARLEVENQPTNMAKLSIHSRIAGCLLIAFLSAYFIINDVFSLNTDVILVLIVAVVLFLLPDIMKIAHKLSYKDIEVIINNGMD